MTDEAKPATKLGLSQSAEGPYPLTPPVRVYPAEEVIEDVVLVDRRGWLRRLLDGLCSGTEWCFGCAALFFGLAVLSTLPVLQFLSLGYLLEASGRISRTGRLRDGFVGVRKAARVGSLVAGTWLWLWPLRFAADAWYSAYLIDPTSNITRNRRIFLFVFAAAVLIHIAWAWCRGGKFRHFLWPAPLRFLKQVGRGVRYAEARDAVWEYLVSLRLPYFFWLGLRGFAGAIAWLFVPIMLYIGATELPPILGIPAGLLGGFLLVAVMIPLPFLQAQFAAERKMTAIFDIVAIIKLFTRAPLAFATALLVTLAFALPLYLLKVEILQREVMIIPSLVFVAFIFPARLLTGWALGLARKRGDRPITAWRLICSTFAFTFAVPITVFFVFILFFTRYTSWYGVWSLFEQHALLVPVPFLGI